MKATAENIRKLVGGHFCTVVFRKRDDSIRTLNGRLGVSKYVKGTDKRQNIPEDVVVIWDRKKEAYRSFRADSVLEIHTGGKTYIVGKNHDLLVKE